MRTSLVVPALALPLLLVGCALFDGSMHLMLFPPGSAPTHVKRTPNGVIIDAAVKQDEAITFVDHGENLILLEGRKSATFPVSTSHLTELNDALSHKRPASLQIENPYLDWLVVGEAVNCTLRVAYTTASGALIVAEPMTIRVKIEPP